MIYKTDLQIEQDGIWISVDIDVNTQFSFNLQQTDLTNPAAIKIPYSNNINLPRTKYNDEVFTHLWRIDSEVTTFNPIDRNNFRLYVNGSLFQSGYIKLEQITKTYYSIRLYGGISNLFWELSQMRLKDLPVDAGNYDHSSIKEDVRDAMITDNGYFGYALTYQGTYDNFDSNQIQTPNGLVDAYWEYAGAKFLTEGLNEHYRTIPSMFGEYRTYYQKPTLKFKPILDTIVTTIEEKYGYEVELDEEFFSESNPHYEDLWLLCNNYEVGDISGGTSFSYSEFGDGNSTVQYQDIQRVENNARGLYRGNTDWNKEIPSDEFISSARNTNMDVTVKLTDAITLEAGDSIDINIDLDMVATYYAGNGGTTGDSSNDNQRYRFKYNVLDITLELYDVNGKILSTAPATTFAPFNTPVQARRYGRENVANKRPSNSSGKGFGHQSFKYDNPGIGGVDYIADGGTSWKFTIPGGYSVDEDTQLFIAMHITGPTWWKPNGSNNNARKYGVAFKIADSSRITVLRTNDADDNTRSGSEKTFSDMVGEDYSVFDLLTSYAKLYGLIFDLNTTTNKLFIGLRDNFYKEDEILDWTGKVDYSKEFTIQPTSLTFSKGEFKYNPLDTKYEEGYRSRVSGDDNEIVDYGSKTINTGYNIEDGTKNFLEGTIFDNCIMVNETSGYFRGRSGGRSLLNDNKELPHIENTDGSRQEINGFIPLFRDGLVNAGNSFFISDDTQEMLDRGTVCWNNDENDNVIRLNEYPKYVRTINKDGDVYSLNIEVPRFAYGETDKECIDYPSSAIYPMYWRGYITDILDRNSKILTCYITLKPSDLQGNILSKFIFIKDTLWVISKIVSFNPVSHIPTKVELLKVKDINNYLDHTNLSDIFELSSGGEVVYSNANPVPEVTIYINDTLTTIPIEVNTTVPWTVNSSLTVTPPSSNESGTANVSMPSSVREGSVIFNYGSQNVVVNIIRQTLVNVTATTNGGTAAFINGQPSPQTLAVGSRVTFTATGNTEIMYWIINGETFYSTSVSYTIQGATTATAYFIGTNQIRLYCDDQYTTITGQTKINNYWVLTVGTSYTFVNTQQALSGFLFSGDTVFRSPGSRTILATDSYLTVYYNQVLLNLTVSNLSPLYEFDGSGLSIGGNYFNFELEPSQSISYAQAFPIDDDGNGEIILERYDYHYPVWTNVNLSTLGIKTMTIQGYRVGWDGDVTETVDEAIVTRTLYAPPTPEWRLTTTNCTASPTLGMGNSTITITLTGGDAIIVQRIGDFDYTLILNNDLDIPAPDIDGTWWTQSMTDGVVKGDIGLTGHITPETSGIYNIGSDALRYNQFYINNVFAYGSSSMGSIFPWNDAVTPHLLGDSRYRWSNLYSVRGDFGYSGFSSIAGSIPGISIRGEATDLNFIGGDLTGGGITDRTNGQISFKSSVNSSESTADAIIRQLEGTHMFIANKLAIGTQQSDGDYSFYDDIFENNPYNFYASNIGCIVITETSDATKKQVIDVVGDVDLTTINVYEYVYTDDVLDTGVKVVKTGLMAQELLHLPNVVYGEEGNYSVNYNAMVALLVKDSQKKDKRIDELEERIKHLENIILDHLSK